MRLGGFRKAAFFLILFLLSIALAQQTHPLSEITPIDVNLSMSNYWILNAGGLGIGTGTPSYPLHVLGLGYIDGLILGGNLDLQNNDILDINTLQANTLLDPDDAVLLVDDDLRVSGRDLYIPTAGSTSWLHFNDTSGYRMRIGSTWPTLYIDSDANI